MAHGVKKLKFERPGFVNHNRNVNVELPFTFFVGNLFILELSKAKKSLGVFFAIQS